MGVLVHEEVATKQPLTLPHRRRLRHCCCGCSLFTGCVVIGSIGLLNGISSLYVGLLSLGHSSSDPAFQESIIVNAITVFYGALHLVTGLSLIYGADKRKPSLLKFWLYTRYVEMVLIIGGALYFMIMVMSHSVEAAPVFLLIFSFTIAIGVLAYCIAIVQSFCQEVTDDIQRLSEEI